MRHVRGAVVGGGLRWGGDEGEGCSGLLGDAAVDGCLIGMLSEQRR